MMNTTPSTDPGPVAAQRPTVPYNSQLRRRRSIQGLSAFLLVLGALPVGLGVNILLYLSRERGWADRAGFLVTLTMALLGTILGWHARHRIQRRGCELYGMTSSTLAMLGGLCTLAACTVVMMKAILRLQ